MTVKEAGWKDGDDGQYNGNVEEYADQEHVGQNVSMYYHQVDYVVGLRISFRAILWEYIEQSHQKIG